MPRKIITDLARRGGNRLIHRTIGKVMPDIPDLPNKRPTLLAGLVGAVAVRIATRSVPGAIVVGGGLLAKMLYDRKQAKRSKKSASTDQSSGQTSPKA